MIKCPKCGSASQIKTVYTQNINDTTILTKYSCICGTDFFVNYEIKNILISGKNDKKIAAAMLKELFKNK